MPPPDEVAAAIRALSRPRCAFVYDLGVLRARAGLLRSALPRTTLLYAVKANSHPAVVRTLDGALDGVDVASSGELSLARSAGARRIVVSGPAKTDALLTEAAAAGATINVESAHELRRIPPGTAITIRVNRPGTGPQGSHRMTGVPTQFGVDPADVPSLLDLARAHHLDVQGFHLHAVSNNLDAAAHAAFIRDALTWSAAQNVDLRTVNVGGGLGVDYTGNAAFDLSRLAVDVPDGVELILEPGRFLAADAGWYAAEVIDLKRTHGRWFAVIRGGTHHFRLSAAWGYSHPFTVLPIDEWPYSWPRPSVTDVKVDVAGELCTPRDILARDAHVTRLRIGDVLVLPRTGAYGWDISHHDFLRHDHPEFVILDR
ncbi:type III PLP-dependent enzyme [Actinoplanes sp. NBRC 103695]|uniref:type III PLP-dependent enzyme n=1 Tax=Actinoplanes sp. NBRC 103695 TaxID=3032202 RepID=UPI0024A08D5D|nr:type III PLP-dependent enzyme [Actinoplanes sp. NBRC 103695]GLY95088.1 staphyloferrin B biosynthesis decarboxylase SbnH [Actinoplanes sp. NBRC 103695]